MADDMTVLRTLGNLTEALKNEFEFNPDCKVTWETKSALQEAENVMVSEYGPDWTTVYDKL